jgi:hypothetical protein
MSGYRRDSVSGSSPGITTPASDLVVREAAGDQKQNVALAVGELRLVVDDEHPDHPLGW